MMSNDNANNMPNDKLDGSIDTVTVRLSGKRTNEYIYEKRYVYSLETGELLRPKRIERSVSGNYWQELYPLHPGKYLVVDVNVDDLETSYKYKRLTVFNIEEYLFEKRRLFPGAELKPFKATYQHGGFEIVEWEEDLPGWLELSCESISNSDIERKEKEEYKQPKEVEDKLSLLLRGDDIGERKKSSVQYLIQKKDKGDNVSKSKEENIVKAVYFRLGRISEVGNMENTVEGMRKAIGGGYAQILKIGKNMAILCDEDGLIRGLPHNRGLRGDWLIVGTRGEEFISLTDEQVEWIVQNVKYINV